MKVLKKVLSLCAIFACSWMAAVGQTGPYGIKLHDKVVVNGVTYNIYGEDGQYDVFVGAPADGSKYKGDIVLAGEVEYEGRQLKVGGIVADQRQNTDTPAFYDTPELNSVTLPDNMYTLRGIVFKNSGIRDIIFPKEYFLWYFDFYEDCPNLTSIHLNSKYTEVGTSEIAAVIPEDAKVALYLDGAVQCNGILGDITEIHYSNNPVFIYNRGYICAPVNEAGGLVLSSQAVIGQFGLSYIDARWVEFPVAEPIEEFSYIYDGETYTIPSPDERVGIHAFSDAKNLERIVCRDPKPWKAHEQAFMNYAPLPDDKILYRTCTLCVPADAIDTYKADPVWGKFENIEAIEDGVDDIGRDMPVISGHDGAPEYYDMQGRRVENPAAGQLVIKRQGDRVTKLVVK